MNKNQVSYVRDILRKILTCGSETVFFTEQERRTALDIYVDICPPSFYLGPYGHPGVTISFETRDVMDSYIKSEQKIYAIKVLREASGLGLKEAKEVVDKMVLEKNG